MEVFVLEIKFQIFHLHYLSCFFYCLIFFIGYFDFTYNVQPKTTQTNHWQTIGDYQQPESGAESTVKGYDEKYNIGEAEEFEAQSVRIIKKGDKKG